MKIRRKKNFSGSPLQRIAYGETSYVFSNDQEEYDEADRAAAEAIAHGEFEPATQADKPAKKDFALVHKS